MSLKDGNEVVPPTHLQEYSVLAATNLAFKQWERLVDALRQVNVSTVSQATTVCPTCRASVPIVWHIFVRPLDKDLVGE